MTDRGTQAIKQPVLATLPSPSHKIAAWWRSLGVVQRGLIALVLLRLVIALAFMLNIIPLDLRFNWYLHHGGDQEIMMDLAESIIAGEPVPVVVGIGQPLIMIPWILLIKPFSGLDFAYFDIVAPLVLINGFLLGGLSVLVMGKIAQLLTRDDRVALWSAGLWSVAPLLSYFVFFWHFDPVLMRSALVPKIGWLNGLSDGPAAFYVLLSVLLLAQIDAGRAQPSLRRMALIGAVFGVAVMFRIHVSPVVAFLLFYILLAYGWRKLLATCVGGLIAYLPQAWYNQVVFRLPITAGYISENDVRFWGSTLHRPLSDIIASSPFHPKHLLELADYLLGPRPWLVLPLGLLVVIAVFVIIHLWKERGWRAVALLIVAPLAYQIPMMLAWPFRYDVIRFTIPSMPFALILGFWAAWRAWDYFAGRLPGNAAARSMREQMLPMAASTAENKEIN